MEKEFFDIGVVIPLEEELTAFFEEFPSVADLSDDDLWMHRVDSGLPEVSMLVCHQGEMGHAAAAFSTSHMLERYRFGLIVCLGIAGSLSDDLPLASVCYSGTVIDVYENSKALDLTEESDGLDIELAPQYFETDTRLARAKNAIRTHPDLKELHDRWQDMRDIVRKQFGLTEVVGRDGKSEPLRKPISINGSIACGAVSKSKAYNKKLKSIDRKILSIETESGAVFREAKRRGVSALTIRGISDYADRNKGKLEAGSAGLVRKLAAQNAASFLKLQLSNPYFLKQIASYRPGQQTGALFDHQQPIETKSIDLVDAIENMVDAKLSELAPEYQFRDRGYKLPVPRIVEHEPLQTGGGPDSKKPIELRKELALTGRILLSIPRSYPEQSLPWVLAKEILDCELHGCQAIPIVIDGSNIVAPNKGLEKNADVDLALVNSESGFHPVFIIENVPPATKSRLAFLEKEVLSHGDASFVFLSTNSENILSESRMKADLQLRVYSVCDISFLEISNFVQHAFSMNSIESEVVAKRLWDTFLSFDMAAHPTYFAGIPKETLTALLQANRRAELLQLAVDGFLTILVADDPAKVSLSRTTRSRFLSDLATELHIERRTYSRSELVQRVTEFAKLQDFNIDPIGFIKEFEDKGILHFEQDSVHFSLSFIERYLLAKSLSENESLAQRYFDFTSHLFDFQIFDIYCELNPHDTVIQSLNLSVEGSLSILGSLASDEHILLTNKLNPQILKSLAKVQTLQERLSKAADDVRNDRSDKDRKQKLLDVTQRVRNSAAKHVGAETEEEATEREIALDNGLKNFALATMLLGSGSEYLQANKKRDLSTQLVNLGASLTDIWTRERSEIDFEAFREELLSDEALDYYREKGNGQIDEEEIRSIIPIMIDFIEIQAVSEPVRRVIGLLCEQARPKVLSESLKYTNPQSEVAEILHALWATDIDPAEGKAKLVSIIKSMKPVTFFRSILALHCLARTTWSHWNKPDRLSLLNVAEMFLQPLPNSMNKAKEIRRIEKQTGEKKDS